MICVICLKAEIETGLVCDWDRARLRNQLAEIPELYLRLPTVIARAGSAGPKVSGTREPQLPVNEDALDLLAAPDDSAVHDDYGDQYGFTSAAGQLGTWVRDWIDVRNAGEREPLPTVWTLCGWLSARLDWACGLRPIRKDDPGHLAIDAFAIEIRALRGQMIGLVGELDPAPTAEQCVGVACTRCNVRDLWRIEGRVECTSCGQLYEDEQVYAEMVHRQAGVMRRVAA